MPAVGLVRYGVRVDDVVRVEGLRIAFRTGRGRLQAVDGVSFGVKRGETLGIVGESGCGKSVTALSLLGLLPEERAEVSATTLQLGGVDARGFDERAWRQLRGRRVAMIFQNPLSALHPVMRIGHQVAIPLRLHGGLSRKQAAQRAVELLDEVGIVDPEARARAYPHELSGGMRQRVCIAMALAAGPDLLVADEPTTALDVSVQAQVIALLKSLQARKGLGMLFISHDLAVVAQVATRIAVMYAGRIVEEGAPERILQAPRHPYTRGLLASLPGRTPKGERLASIPGHVPDLHAPPVGCRFAPRCEFADAACQADPQLGEHDARLLACHHPVRAA